MLDRAAQPLLGCYGALAEYLVGEHQASFRLRRTVVCVVARRTLVELLRWSYGFDDNDMIGAAMMMSYAG
jgi:hypothetical protein